MKNLRDWCHESVQDTLERIGIITEMSVPLKIYKKRVDGLRFQLVENWCLCKWCQMFDPTNQNFNHWISEFKACTTNLKYLDLKEKANKRRTLVKMLIRDYDYEDPSMIEQIIRDKFDTEHIKETWEVAEEFTKNVRDLIDVISQPTRSVKVYVKEMFKDD